MHKFYVKTKTTLLIRWPRCRDVVGGNELYFYTQNNATSKLYFYTQNRFF